MQAPTMSHNASFWLEQAPEHDFQAQAGFVMSSLAQQQ